MTVHSAGVAATLDLDKLLRQALALLAGHPAGSAVCLVVRTEGGPDADPATEFVQQVTPAGGVELLRRAVDKIAPGDVVHRATTLDPRHDTKILRAAHEHGKGLGPNHIYVVS